MAQAFEAIMLICFGISWPFNIAKSLRSRTAKGKSLQFEICVVIGYLFGPVTGFFAGYIGTIVWALLSGNFIPLHSPLADGITVGLSAALPALIHLRNGKKDLLELTANKGKFIAVSLFWSILFGILMILTTSISLSYFTGLEYTYCVIWIGIADVVPIALTPFVVLLLAKRMKNIRNIVPYI